MRTRQNKLGGALKGAVEQGLEAVTSAVHNSDLDDRYAAGQQQAAKVLAQLPIVLPHLSDLKQRATDGFHDVAHAIGDQKVLPVRAQETESRRGRHALLLAVSLGIGAAIAQAIRRRQNAAVDPLVGAATAEQSEPEMATSPSEADDHANGSASLRSIPSSS